MRLKRLVLEHIYLILKSEVQSLGANKKKVKVKVYWSCLTTGFDSAA